MRCHISDTQNPSYSDLGADWRHVQTSIEPVYTQPQNHHLETTTQDLFLVEVLEHLVLLLCALVWHLGDHQLSASLDKRPFLFEAKI